ncbi:hypothetical protein E8E13_009110 [Curvularia kusanoi]|uniref:Uncharacterized protein n=1 Tax=Curvularia kusanoi TaxID=90978 RepID=A0A9P4WC59_CURKU|nr:hypothetical protein E8E13_009110 [Curvularia kusanoi]
MDKAKPTTYEALTRLVTDLYSFTHLRLTALQAKHRIPEGLATMPVISKPETIDYLVCTFSDFQVWVRHNAKARETYIDIPGMVGEWMDFVTVHGLEVNWVERRGVSNLSNYANNIAMCIHSIRSDFEDHFKVYTRGVKPNHHLGVITPEKHAAAVEANKAINTKVDRLGPYARQHGLANNKCYDGYRWGYYGEPDYFTVSTQPNVQSNADPLSPADQKVNFSNINYSISDFDNHADCAATTAGASTRPRTSAPQQRVASGRVSKTASDKNKANTTKQANTTMDANTTKEANTTDETEAEISISQEKAIRDSLDQLVTNAPRGRRAAPLRNTYRLPGQASWTGSLS